jgi:hypothetical protein
MTEQLHPITPPPELVEQWYDSISDDSTSWKQEFAIQSARWGADQELEECCEWLDSKGSPNASRLRTARRPKPPSLKEQALAALNEIEDKMLGPTIEEKLIRRAIESLPS